MSTKARNRSPSSEHSTPDQEAEPDLLRLCQTIDHAAHLLPAQGPITVFIHHNTLHAFEDLPFTEAVKRAASVFGCQPYLSEDRYRQEMGRGRIRFADLEAVVRANLKGLADEKVLGRCTRLELRLALLQYPLRFGPTEELLWFVAETDALRRIRDDVSVAVRGRLVAETRRWVMRDLRSRSEAVRPRSSAPALDALLERFGEARIEEWEEDVWEAFTLQALWRVCCEGVAGVPELALPPLLPLRHRDLLLLATGADADMPVHDVLIRFCGAFLDQGLASWQFPRRDDGFYRAFVALYGQPGGPPDHGLRGLAVELARLEDGRVSPLRSIRASLDILGVPAGEWDDFLSATLLALRGWAGMIRFLEKRGDRAVHPVSENSLVEFLAIRLVLDRVALAAAARDTLGFTGPLSGLRGELRRRIGTPRPRSVEQRAFLVFQLAQVLGWAPQELHQLGEGGWATLVDEIEMFTAIDRRRTFHLAYEHRFTCQALDALALHARDNRTQPVAPHFQAIFCLDEREESMRRHLEELAPDVVTFSIAGFYFLDMYYRGAEDAHFVPLCPAVMRPQHWVVERPLGRAEAVHLRRARVRKALGIASWCISVGSRTLGLGALLSAAVGVLASVPLVARTLFPRLAARMHQALARMVLAAPPTRLRLERSDPTPTIADCGLRIADFSDNPQSAIDNPQSARVGYTLEEMTDIAERVLRDTGLTSGFASLVLMFGHGSTSMNNPHESAHDCGACGGARGGPNARAIAQILNDPRVRQRLHERGLVVPSETVFVGGQHNTSTEAVTFYDLDLLPESHRQAFKAARCLVEQAADRDAHERCRRFHSAPLTLSYAEARQHVEGRAEDLAQVRPEWGHATNALCVVGRRQRTRGLFLDRRAFLSSYDPTQDDAEASVLTRVLQAAVPVCAGISLEYYFSRVDNAGFGCGTKLPHNIAALVGVMDGAASDLRTGLPWQMVEIHEPVRILFVVETTPPVMQRILDHDPAIGRLVGNSWIQLATLDPDSPAIHLYREGAFHAYSPEAERLPQTRSSIDWYRGWRDHLEFATIAGVRSQESGIRSQRRQTPDP